MRVLVACKRGNIAPRDKHGHCQCEACKAYNYSVQKNSRAKAAYKKQWVKDHPDKVEEYWKRCRNKNREAINARGRERNKREDVREKRNADRRNWAAREKQKAVDYKGGKCCVCGYDSCLACLDFHHPDPTQKNGYGTGALKAHWSFEKNKSELDKCVLVCVRCHREIHAGVTECPSAY